MDRVSIPVCRLIISLIFTQFSYNMMCRHLSHKSLSLGLHKWSRHPYVDTNICCVVPFIHAIPGKLKARSNVTQVKGDQYVQRWTYNMSNSILVSILGDRFPLSFSLWLWLWLLLSHALSPPSLPLSLSLCLSLSLSTMWDTIWVWSLELQPFCYHEGNTERRAENLTDWTGIIFLTVPHPQFLVSHSWYM